MSNNLRSITRGIPMLALLLVFGATRQADGTENWTSYRGPTDQGIADDAHLPLEWSEEENVVWKTAVEGKAWSSPVIWGDRIFLTNAPADGSRLSIVCIDKNSGTILYNKRLHTVPLPQYCHPFNSYASPSPVVEQGRVYVSFGSAYNACLDSETGDVLWQRTDFVCNHFRGPASSPLLDQEKMYLHFDGSDAQYVVALNKHTGETLWRTDRTVDFDDLDPATGKPDRQGDWRKAYSTPVIAEVNGRQVLVSLGSMALYGYDPQSGKELWRVDFIGSHSGACRPVVRNGLIYVSTGSGAELLAIRPGRDGGTANGLVAWNRKRAVPRRPSVLVVEDLVFMVNDSGIATCVEAQTGETIWVERLGGNYSASPLYANGYIYFLDEVGKTTVVKAGREFEIVATNLLDEGFMASPAVSGDALFLRTRTHLYRIEDSSGDK